MAALLAVSDTRVSRRWYRSLYWRIAMGFVLSVAAVVAVQAFVVLWLLSQDGPPAGPPPPGFARLVAQDLSRALAAAPELDLEAFIGEEYQRRLYPIAVVLRDGQVIAQDGASPSAEVVERARLLMSRQEDPGVDLGSRRGPPPARGLRGRGRGAGLGGTTPFAAIRVQDQIIGLVVVVPQTLVERLGPTLAATGTAALAVATALMALVIFGPVRRRLSDLEHATSAVGRGQLTARAREDGGDEVADLARAFNRMTADLAARAHEAAESDRIKRGLLADVSHELMTPLTSMRGYLDTMAMPSAATDQKTRERYLRIVSDETRRLEDLVGDLLDLSRLEAGGAALDMQDVSIEGLLGAVAARHELAAMGSGIRLSYAVEPGAEIVRGDARRLEQALQNLVANALRHTPTGGAVSLKCRLDGGDVVIAVQDTGHGIAPEHLPNIFDRFYKGDTSRAGSAAGSGLGLSIVKAVVDRHGGTIAVFSSPDGTTFELRLPTG